MGKKPDLVTSRISVFNLIIVKTMTMKNWLNVERVVAAGYGYSGLRHNC